MKILYSSQFIRSFKKLPCEIQNIYRVKEKLFINNQFDYRLNTHKVKIFAAICEDFHAEISSYN